jgi:hypothetical protein
VLVGAEAALHAAAAVVTADGLAGALSVGQMTGVDEA